MTWHGKVKAMSCPVDAHVHFHRLDLVVPTLEAAARNFKAAENDADRLVGMVLLTQVRGETVFELLRTSPEVAGWTFSPVPDEQQSLIARREGQAIGIVCGRQVRAADGLEVLALGTVDEYPDHLPFGDAVDRVRASGALTVLPWGFGKWWGERGKRVERLLDQLGPGSVFVGDNGSRPGVLGRPRLIEAAEHKGFRVLPGTDPFPISGGQRRVGVFGFHCDFDPPPAAPWGALRRWLESRPESPPAYGPATGALRFVLDQVGLRLHKKS
jgi:hypothetical protein